MKKTVLAAVAAGALAVIGVGGAAIASAGGGEPARVGLGTAAPAAATPSGSPADDRGGDRDGRDRHDGDDRDDLDDRGRGGGDDVATPAPAGADALTARQAVVVAVHQVGGGRVSEIEKEWEHGRLVWKVEVHHGSTEYDIRVDAGTGEVVRFERDDD